MLIEDVHDAIFDLVELIKAFQSKNKLSKVLMSTLFKRRQDELDAVVDRAIMRLQVSVPRLYSVAQMTLRLCPWVRKVNVLHVVQQAREYNPLFARPWVLG